jgi:diketogulonate reductase-like aldo/keto reductase
MSGQLLRTIKGVQVPAIGFGTWRLNGDEAYQSVKSALEIGYRHVDTARMYGNEAEVARAIKDSGVPRGDIFLTSKVWYSDASADGVAREIDRSLEALATDHVDLFLLHWPTDEVPLEETLGALARAKEQGKTRLFGVSNFPSTLLRQACALADVANDQLELHPYLQMATLRAVADELGVLVTAYAPLAKGKVADDPLLQQVAEAHGATPTQVALAYLLSLGVVVIPKSSHPARQRENLGALELTLSHDDRQQIAALERGLRQTEPAFGPDWSCDT